MIFLREAIILVSAIFIIAALLVFLSYICYLLTFYTDRRRHLDVYHGLSEEEIRGNEKKQFSRSLIDSLLKIPYERVYTKSHDSLTLSARYYHASDTAPLEIHFHGYKSISVHDFSGGTTEAIRRGHNVLLVDQRAHGESEGRTISFGVKEREDVVAWCKWATERLGENVRISLAGISMGAATVLMASELNLPENVVGIVADCPFSYAPDVIGGVIRKMHLPPAVLLPFVRLGGRIFGGFDICAASPKSAVTRTKIPILLIHGEGDMLVPAYMSDEIADVGRTVTLVKFADAGHGLSFVFDNEKYLRALDDFYEKINLDNR